MPQDSQTTNLFDLTIHELQTGRSFEIGDEVTGRQVISHPSKKGVYRGTLITGVITHIGWKYIRTDRGDIWRDDARFKQTEEAKQTSFF